MSYIVPYIDIFPINFNTNDYSTVIKTTIGKLKDEINYEQIIPKLFKNTEFADFVESSNYKFQVMENYFSKEVETNFDIYGGTYSENVDNIEYTIKIYFYKIKNPELLTSDIIDKFELIFRYDYFTKNNILNMTWHNYRLSLFFDNINQHTKQQFYKIYNNHPLCKTKLYYHQMNNITKMLYIHYNSTDIYISDNMPMYFDNNLIYDMVKRKFIQQSDIKLFKLNSGMIFDEPGTGKTLQFILYLLEVNIKALVLVPNDNIKQVWISEFNKHINLEKMPFTILTFNELQNDTSLLAKFELIGIDEIHNLYKKNNTLFDKIVSSNIKYRWGITGTPFITDDSLFNIIKFLTGDIFNNERIANIPSLQNNFLKLFLKNCKIDMINDYNWPDLNIENIFVELDLVQKNIYNTEKKLLNRTDNLRKLVCEIQLTLGELNIQTPKELKEYCIIHYKKLYDNEIEKLNKLLIQYDNIIKNEGSFNYNEFIERINHFKKLIDKQKDVVQNNKSAYKYFKNNIENISNIIDKKNNDETCPICLGEHVPPIIYIKICGHYFCKDCIDSVISDKISFKCPICRNDTSKEDIIYVNNISYINYSAKIHKLLDIIKDSNKKYIIFTQFDKVINNFEKYLTSNSISCQVYNDNNFNKDAQVLILSSSNNAEGINLSMYDSIIIFEPFQYNMFYKEIEKQLIARIYRIGRTESVNVIRLITKDTIEEEIYKN
jgi:SNF2 family DNA or RNA helicase